MFQLVSQGVVPSQAPAAAEASTPAVEYEALVKAPPETEIFSQDQCVICFDDFDKPVLLPCRHVFCFDCIVSWSSMSSRCPNCRSNIEARRAPARWMQIDLEAQDA
jgi:hypothetical protein